MIEIGDRAAIVSGGAGALGSAVVQRLVREKCHCAVPFRSERPLLHLREILGAEKRFHSEKVDLASPEATKKFVEHAVTSHGSIALLINCVGGYEPGHLVEETGDDEIERMFSVNFRTVFNICREVLPMMKRSGMPCRIINIAARLGLDPSAKTGAYSIAKSAVVTLTKVIGAEVAGTPITANAIAPTTIAAPENARSMLRSGKTGGLVQIDDIIETILFLCSDSARMINGQVLSMG